MSPLRDVNARPDNGSGVARVGFDAAGRSIELRSPRKSSCGSDARYELNIAYEHVCSRPGGLELVTRLSA